MDRRRSLILALAVAACTVAASAQPAAADAAGRFEKRRLSWQYWSEGASLGDLNGDGHVDVVCGAHFYLGPDFRSRREYAVPVPGNKRHAYDPEVYTLDHFFSWVHDFNGDGRPDILVVPLPTREVCWFENPGRVPEPPEVLHWKKHPVLPRVLVETSVFHDITGDGRPELVCGMDGRLGYARQAANPTAPWEFIPVTPSIDVTTVFSTSHGLGVGDVDGDGRLDLLRPDGWWQQPRAGTEWVFHRFVFTPRGGGDMYAYDVNGDGLADVITSINAHGWGLSWFEQVRTADGAIGFREHEIMGKAGDQAVNPQGVQFSQLHAVALVDLDGDGLKDILTGKTFLAHENVDPGLDQPPVVCWFRLVRHDGRAEFVPEVIDDEAGIGRRIDTGDIDGNGTPDFVIGNKKGCTLYLQKPPR